jgi:carbon-monoxide dehydrogenase medium subunit
MSMQTFQYHRVANAAEAAKQVAGKDDARFLAGGQSLLATMKMRLAAPTDLVDLAGIAELAGIRVEGNAIVIGAMTRHVAVAESKDVQAKIPALAALAGGIGDRQVRNMGTLGGSIAHNDPAACYPAAVLGLGATVHTSKRKIAADDYFKGMYESALEPGELITAVSFPIPEKCAYVKFKSAASRFALVGVFVSKSQAGVRIAVTGAGSRGVFRAHKMEEALAKNWSADAIKALHVPASALNGDIHASAEYRSHLVTVIAGRAIAAAK